MKIKIESGVQMPGPGNRIKAGRPNKYPFADMKVGDCFYSKGLNTRHTIYSALKNYNANPTTKKKINITTHMEGDGIRVWRIK